jgi:hypothetical protein
LLRPGPSVGLQQPRRRGPASRCSQTAVSITTSKLPSCPPEPRLPLLPEWRAALDRSGHSHERKLARVIGCGVDGWFEWREMVGATGIEPVTLRV